MIELTYLLAVFSSIAYGAADFLGGLATKRTALFAVVVFSQLSGLILVLLALPVLPRDPGIEGSDSLVEAISSDLRGGR